MLSAPLAVVIAIFEINLTILPAYIRLSPRYFRRIRVEQGGHLEERSMLGSEELSYEAAVHRIFAREPGEPRAYSGLNVAEIRRFRLLLSHNSIGDNKRRSYSHNRQ